MDISSDFLLGVVVSEGAFFISLYHKESGNVRPAPAFAVKMNDEMLLRKMKSEIGAGRITTQGGDPVWQTQAESDCWKIRRYIEENKSEVFEICNKSNQYETWCRALDMLDGETNTKLPKDIKIELVDMSFSITPTNNGRATTKEEWYERVENE